MDKYTYRKDDSEDIWTVGYEEGGEWIPESDWGHPDFAGIRMLYLNKGFLPYDRHLPDRIRARIEEAMKTYRKGVAGVGITDYGRGAADACANMLDMDELKLFLKPRDNEENRNDE